MGEPGQQRTFHLPDLGEGLTEAELLEWLVSPGQEVRAGEPGAIVETDKAQVEVASPWSGRVARLHGAVGTRIRTGEALDEFELAEEAAAPETHEDAGTVVGTLPETLSGAPHTLSGAVDPADLRAMPAARARARELGVSLGEVIGTGPDRVITRSDVESAAQQGGDARLSEGEPLRGVRLAMARNMARARASIASATVMDEVDVERWWVPEADVALRLVRAIATACAAEPALNAWFDERRLARSLHRQVDLAIAIQTQEGLFAPVLRGVESATETETRQSIDRLAAAAAARTLQPSELRGATITLSNFGRLGGRHAMLVVVPPQVAILGAGRIEARVVVRDGAPAVRSTLPLSLTFDHRAVTGAEAARFLASAREDLESVS